MIELRGVSKAYGHPVLREISWHVPEGTLYGIVGPGAAGKSVLLKVIAGLVKPDSGEVVVGGTSLGGLSELELQEYRKGIGMLFQNNALFDFMTVADNIAFPLRRLFNLSDQEVQEKIAERLQVVSLPGFEDRLPAGLSGGQKKRIGIARATVIGAPILLYDEPAAGLDPVTSQRIFNLLRDEQRESGATAIMVSSDLQRLFSVVDRVAMMLEGRLIFDGTTEQALEATDPRVHQFMHGLPDGPL